MNQRFRLSPTVQEVQKELQLKKAISTVDIVASILYRHSEYGLRLKGLNTVLLPTDSEQKHFEVWLSEVEELFDIQKISRLHGRVVIIGLSLLDEELEKQLNKNAFLKAIIDELKEPLQDILSTKGFQLYTGLASKEATSSNPIKTTKKQNPQTKKKILSSDRIGSYSDSPESDPKNDKLGRAAYARYLVQRILAVDSEDAFSMHIGGPWGSGKSTLLNFMKAEFNNDPKNKWVVVEFNAWQNQHIDPPWWPLLDAVFQKGKKYLGWRAKIREHWWRIVMGKTHIFFGIFLIALILFSIFIYIDADLDLLEVVKGKDGEEVVIWSIASIGAAITAVLGLWSGFQGVSSIFMSRSTKTAESYMETTTNPMEKISEKFSTLVKRIGKNKKDNKGTRVAIIIDDMDRCQTSYVVALLEGIQTLFNKERVVFIVAADQRWLHACFEDSYQKLKAHVQEPGKGLGTLFLEKVFQFVVPIPAIPEKVSDAYWMDLLKKDKADTDKSLISLRAEAKLIVEKMESEEELLQEIEDNSDFSFAKKQLIREEAIVRLAAPELAESIENHTLAPFASLLNPNPRSMKRLVNSYSVNRALSTLGRLDIPQKELALWTILSMRWPSLARHLENNPEDINHIKENKDDSIKKLMESGLNESIVILFADNDVQKIINNNNVQTQLTSEIIIKCAMLRM